MTRPGRVLLVEADADPVFSVAAQRRLETYYPAAEVYRFEQGGHMVGFTHHVTLNALLHDFLEAPIQESAVLKG